MEYDPMLTFDQLFKANPREKLLEMRIENLQGRIHELEQRSSFRYSLQPDIRNQTQPNRSSFLVLPIAYTPAPEPSPRLEIVPYATTEDQYASSTIFIEQPKTQTCETVV